MLGKVGPFEQSALNTYIERHQIIKAINIFFSHYSSASYRLDLSHHKIIAKNEKMTLQYIS